MLLYMVKYIKNYMYINQPKTAYLFDIDGVLTDPQAKRVELPEIFDELIKRLKQGFQIGLNTGRSLDFIIKEILDPLESKITDKKLLHNIIAIGEKGAAWITYDEKGDRTIRINENITVQQYIQSEVKKLINKQPYSETMFYDDTKRTMISIEELPVDRRIGTHEVFKTAQNQLKKELHNLLTRHKLNEVLKIDPTRIATDIQNKHVGKALGARKFVEIMKERGIDPQKYLCFGDSASDHEMFEELLRLGKQTQFIFVGGREHLTGKDLDGVIFTDQHVDKGTLEFLQNE